MEKPNTQGRSLSQYPVEPGIADVIASILGKPNPPGPGDVWPGKPSVAKLGSPYLQRCGAFSVYIRSTGAHSVGTAYFKLCLGSLGGNANTEDKCGV